MEYQPISDVAQLHALEGLMAMVLHGVLLVYGAACLLLLGLCLSELRLPRRARARDGVRDRSGEKRSSGLAGSRLVARSVAAPSTGLGRTVERECRPHA